MTETHFDANAALKLGQDVLSHEADAILAASRRIGETPDFAQAVKAILGCRGRLVVSGVGNPATLAESLRQLLLQQALRHFSCMPAKPHTVILA